MTLPLEIIKANFNSKDDWKSFCNLRKTTEKLSGRHYPISYTDKYNLTQHSHCQSFSKTPSAWIYEPVEVAVNSDGNIIYRIPDTHSIYKKQQERFETSKGLFVSHNNGEFGGSLITPKETIYGNFKEVFECNDTIYAIDSLNHLGIAHTKIYSFTKKLKSKLLYSSVKNGTFMYDELIDFEAYFISENTVYILASGFINDAPDYKTVSYLFILEDGKISKIIQFDYILNHIYNMIIHEDKMILGMDKTVMIVNMNNKCLERYTFLSLEAENNLMDEIF